MSADPRASPSTPRSAMGSRRQHSSRIGSSRSVAMSPPKSPAMHRVPSSILVKQIEHPPTPNKWQRQHEQSTMKQLGYLRENKKCNKKLAKAQAQTLARKIPLEMLAKEWLSDNQASLNTRAFLVENILPTLILGTEKLLMKASELNLTEQNEFDANFNPINFLAQYLMRNNPRYSNFSEASPYVRSLREVGEELKKQIFELEDNKLARIKNEARRKREERERAVEAKKHEKKRRDVALREQFLEWNIGEGHLEVALIQSALKSFADMTEYLPEELQEGAKYSYPVEQEESERGLNIGEYVEYITLFIDEFSAPLFDQFVEHLYRCAKAFKAELQKEQRRVTLSNLFVMCDRSGVGVLDRHRVLSLFESFYDNQDARVPTAERKLRNPRKWPVVEVDEADSDYSDDEDSAAQTQDLPPKEKEDGVVITTDDTTAETLPADAGAPGESERPSSAEEKHEGEASEKKENKVADTEQLAGEKEENKEENTEENKEENTEVKEGETVEPAIQQQDGDEKTDQVAEHPKESESDTEPTGEPTTSSEQKATAPTTSQKETDEAEKAAEAPAPLIDGSQEKVPPTRTGAYSVSFAEGTNLLERERTTDEDSNESRLSSHSPAHTTGSDSTMERIEELDTRGTGSQSQMSAFDENTLNMPQFVQLTETFLGDFPVLEVFQALCRYMRDGYIETEEEKLARLKRAHQEMVLSKQKNRMDHLFEKWDNEGSGYLEMEEVETIIHKYKDGLEKQAINRGRKRFLEKIAAQTGMAPDTRLTKIEFRDFITTVCDEIPGDGTFDFFVDFVESSVERTYAERIRGEARKKWLQQILSSADTSGASLEIVYRSVFQSLYRDAETHGNGKVISSNITMLERNLKHPQRGANYLRYVATTSDDAFFLLNKFYYKDMQGISFAAIDTGKPLHVPRVSNHGNIQFWNPDRNEEDRDGSFVVIPLKDSRRRIFGTIGVDTLRDPRSKSIFITHEIQYYQGVAKAFSEAYHKVDTKRKTMRITESAISWICRRSPNVHEINVYLVEPDGKDEDYVLRRMMVAQGEKADVKAFDFPSRLERKENLFRDYLFKCVDNSETVSADAYGQRHFAFPLRGSDGRVVVVIDISTGEVKQMPKHERKEIIRMLKLVQKAQKEITREAEQGDKTMILEAEKESEDTRVEIMFDRLMLMDLRKNVSKLDARAYAELKSYKEPTKIIHNILKATLNLFYPDMAAKGAFEDWHTCKMHINSELNGKITRFDPTIEGSENIPVEMIGKPLEDVPHGVVAKHSSVPAEYLYNWIFVCLSLIQHTKRMRLSNSGDNTSKAMLPTGMTPDIIEDDDE